MLVIEKSFPDPVKLKFLVQEQSLAHSWSLSVTGAI
jgi:hypothetical protein